MKKLNLPLALACFATLGLAVACGKGGNNNNASIKQMRQEEVIGQAIKESFPGYMPEDAENILMAARFLGATLEIKGRQEKTAKTAAMVGVRISFLLENPDVEISAEGALSEGAAIPMDLVKVDKDSELPSGYSMTARCLPTSGCNQVMVLLVHEEDIVAGTTTSESQTISDAKALAGGTVSGGTVTEEKPLDVPVMKPKKQSMVAVLFAIQKDKSMTISWSASPTIGNFMKGGKRVSVADAKAERSAAAKKESQQPAAQSQAPAQPSPAQPLAPKAEREAGHQDPLPPVQGEPSDTAIPADT